MGTWTLQAADVVHPDGSREHDYGSAPRGLFIVDPRGHYSLGPVDAMPMWNPGEPIPLAVLEPLCMFRRTALAALDRAGMPWHIVFTSPSLHGLWAAVEAGLGVTVRTAAGLPAGVQRLGSECGLPTLLEGPRQLCLHDGGRTLAPAAARLANIIAETVPRALTNP